MMLEIKDLSCHSWKSAICEQINWSCLQVYSFLPAVCDNVLDTFLWPERDKVLILIKSTPKRKWFEVPMGNLCFGHNV